MTSPTDAIRRLVGVGKAIVPSKIGAASRGTNFLTRGEDLQTLHEAVLAVESLLSHCELVEIPQGETCEGCLFSDQGCQNPRKPKAKDGLAAAEAFRKSRNDRQHDRSPWCRKRYGYKEDK